MKNDFVIKEDITEEAKATISNAMNNFCKVENKEEKAKAMYISERHNYWLSLGFSNEIATLKANDDFNWQSN